MGQVLEFPKAAITRPQEVINYDPNGTIFAVRCAYVKLAITNLDKNRGSREYEQLAIWAVDDFLKWLKR